MSILVYAPVGQQGGLQVRLTRYTYTTDSLSADTKHQRTRLHVGRQTVTVG